MNRIIRSFLGEYTISLPAEKAPVLFEQCKKRGIFFFLPIPQNQCVLVKTSLFSCKAFLECAKEMDCECSIVSVKGLPFVLNRYRCRYGIYLGIILSAAILLYSSLFLWEVNVTGNKNISETEILKVLSAHGVGVGTYIPSLDADRTAEYILLDYSPLSSLAINVKGTVATVDVIERVPVPEDTFPKEGYCNLVASHDGIITNVVAAEGHPEVKIGQIVTEGQLLINGFVQNRYGTYKVVNATGYVFADVTENLVFEVPLIQKGIKYTGNTETKREIYIIGFPIRLYNDSASKYEFYETAAKEKQVVIFGQKLPVTVSEITYREYIPDAYKLTEAEAIEKANIQLENWCKNICDGEIVSLETDAQTKNGAHLLKVRVVINKNIALRKEITVIQPNKP